MAQIEDLLDESVLAAALEQYRRDRTGLLTILPSAMSYLPLSQFTPQAVLSDMQAKSKELLAHFSSDQKLRILSRQFSPETNKLGQMEYVFELGNWNPTFQPDRSDGKRYCSMVVILQYPFSKGSVHIRRPDSDGSESDAKPTASLPPVIDPQYYAGPHGELDLEAMVHGVRFGQEICRTKPVADIIRGPAHPSQPVTNEEEVRAWVAQNTITCWHPIGTCAMGGSGGKATGVVDSRLRVYGVKGLRVVDASVMPLHISAHPQATVYAIAEKAADMIREDMLVS
jgi:choline dehydrogenase-like flavoprotein